MQQKILNILELQELPKSTAVSQLSFKSFLDYIRNRITKEQGFRKEIYSKVLDSFAQYPELEGRVELNDLEKYKEQLDILCAVLNPTLQDESNLYWALAIPVNPIIFYGSCPFYELMSDDLDCGNVCEFEDPVIFKKQMAEHFYSFILRNFYGININEHTDFYPFYYRYKNKSYKSIQDTPGHTICRSKNKR